MSYKTCENCGCKVYSHGCVNCNEGEYISMQSYYDRGWEDDSKKSEKVTEKPDAPNTPSQKQIA